MIKKQLTIIYVLAIFIIGPMVQPAFTEEEVKEYSNQDEIIEVSIGESFNIELECNEATGYSWQFNRPLDDEILKFVSSKYVPYSTDEPLGAGGKEVWTFRAVGAGETVVYLFYGRVWEKYEAPAINRRQFNVTVE